MAKIYYLRHGSGPKRVIGGKDLSMEELIKKVGNKNVKYVGNQPPTFPSEREDLTPVRDPSYTLAQVETEEVNQRFSKEGFYLLEGVSPKEASSW